MALFGFLLNWTQETFGSFGLLGLFTLAFAESSFFPIPPDILLIAFALATPQNAFVIATIATIGSVVGGIFGYFLGKSLGEPLLLKFAKKSTVKKAQKLYDEFGAWAVFAAGFSPIPYKIFTILSGVMELDLKKFIIASTISRAMRFFAIATVIFFFGEEINGLLNEYFEIAMFIIAIPIILFVCWKFYKKIKK